MLASEESGHLTPFPFETRLDHFAVLRFAELAEEGGQARIRLDVVLWSARE